jgi:hypothetical protein
MVIYFVEFLDVTLVCANEVSSSIRCGVCVCVCVFVESLVSNFSFSEIIYLVLCFLIIVSCSVYTAAQLVAEFNVL